MTETSPSYLLSNAGSEAPARFAALSAMFDAGTVRHLAEVRRHDVTTDPLPDGALDLIHMRLVLVHLPDWQHVLTQLLTALKPGG